MGIVAILSFFMVLFGALSLAGTFTGDGGGALPLLVPLAIAIGGLIGLFRLIRRDEGAACPPPHVHHRHHWFSRP